MAKNKYTVVWKPDFEDTMFVTWIELDFEVHQHIASPLWEELLQALVDAEDLDTEVIDYELNNIIVMHEVEAVFEGHLDSKFGNMGAL